MTALLAVSARRRSVEDLPVTGAAGNFSAESLPLTDGAPVAEWANPHGDAALSTGSPPTYRTNQRNSLPAAQFTAASQHCLAIDPIGSALTGTQAFTVFTVQSPNPGASNMSPLVLENSGSVLPVHHIYNGRAVNENSEHRTVRRNLAGTVKSRGQTPKADIPAGTWAITANRFSGTSDTCWINGVQKWVDFDLDVGAVSLDAATIGGWRKAGIQFYDGLIGQLVVYPFALTDAEVHAVGNHLAAKWDIDWGPHNASAPLSIPVPNVGGAIHPDVIDFGSEPFAGYRYWMAFTPYDGTEPSEDPCVVATNDITNGGTWTVPTGYTNPLMNLGGGTHMADTDMVYDEATGRLYVVYVFNDYTNMYVRGKWTTGDGSWSDEFTVLSEGYEGCLNPSIVKTDTGWSIYYIQASTPRQLLRRDSTTSPHGGYGDEVVCSLTLSTGSYPGLPRRPQNLNIIRDDSGDLTAVISDSPAGSSLGGSLLFAHSDDGLDFQRLGPTVIDTPLSSTWDSDSIYRASIVTDTNGNVVIDGGHIHCFYSARDASGDWGTGYALLDLGVLHP